MKVAGLFAGIGGFEVGFKRAGYDTAFLCELDSRAQSVLRANFPGVDLVGDIRDVRALPADVDVLCAGFPCQDLSSSGHKAGIRGGRSSLVSDVFRILRKRPAPWVVIENVPFMLRLSRGEAIRRITVELEKLGYRWAYRVVDSQAFDVPHRRKRVFLVASQVGDPRIVLHANDNSLEYEPLSPHAAAVLDTPTGFYWTEGTYATGLANNAVPPLKGGSSIGIPSPPAILLPDGQVITPDIKDAERLQGFEADWTAPAGEVARASGRWTLIGNAVTVNVAEWLAKRIATPPNYPRLRAGIELSRKDPWPDAAWSEDGRRMGAAVSHYPRRVSTGLDGFLRYPGRPLSRKATEGFLRRAQAGGLRFPPGFLDALQRFSTKQWVTRS